MCWLACRSSSLLSAISRNRRAFWIASTDCAAKRLHQPHGGFGEFADRAALQYRRPEDAVGADQRHDQHRAVAGGDRQIAQRVGRPLAQIGDLQRRAAGDRLAHPGDVFADIEVAHSRTIASL